MQQSRPAVYFMCLRPITLVMKWAVLFPGNTMLANFKYSISYPLPIRKINFYLCLVSSSAICSSVNPSLAHPSRIICRSQCTFLTHLCYLIKFRTRLHCSWCNFPWPLILLLKKWEPSTIYLNTNNLTANTKAPGSRLWYALCRVILFSNGLNMG